MSVIGSLASVLGKLNNVLGSAQRTGQNVNAGLGNIGQQLRGHMRRGGGRQGPAGRKAINFLTRGTMAQKLQKVQKAGRKVRKAGMPNLGASISKAGTIASAMLGNPMAIAKAATMVISNDMEHIQKSLGYSGKAIGSERMGAVGGSVLRMGAETAEGAIDPAGLGYGKIATAPVKFAAALVESIDKLQDFSHGLHDSNMKFTEFSGAMAAVKARQDVREIHLIRQRGSNRAESAERVASSMNRLDVAKAPIEDAWAKLKAELVSPLLDGVAGVLEGLNLIGEKLGILKKPKDQDDPIKWFEEASGLTDFGRPRRGEK